MQVEVFEDLYKKYQDTETSPATENVEKIIMRLEQPFTYYYDIVVDGIEVGAIRVVDKKGLIHILCIYTLCNECDYDIIFT